MLCVHQRAKQTHEAILMLRGARRLLTSTTATADALKIYRFKWVKELRMALRLKLLQAGLGLGVAVPAGSLVAADGLTGSQVLIATGVAGGAVGLLARRTAVALVGARCAARRRMQRGSRRAQPRSARLGRAAAARSAFSRGGDRN